MKLYDTLSRRVDTLPRAERPISLYICGITPYDTTHLGHAFTYATTDVLIRYLQYRGYDTDYVQNVTDIDDDILRRAGKVEQDWKELGDRWTAHFIRDMQALNVLPPDHFPRATDVISAIVDVVQRLVEAGVAYEAGGSVYFHVDAWSEYGKLSRLSYEEMLPIANERGNDPDDPNKRDPLDFVLWQAQAPGEPAWDSPWGPGRPGWHIECSTMSTFYLGDTVDVHGGGTDLIFPHHESEIAQAEVATGRQPFVRFWLHTAMVHHEGEKMSKSLGNLVMVRDLLETWPPDALRVYLASHHYREVWSYDEEELARGAQLAERLRDAAAAEGDRGAALDPGASRDRFVRAMDDDLRTPEALATLDALAGEIVEGARAGKDVHAAQEELRSMGRVFGLRLDTEAPEARVTEGWERHLQSFVTSETF